MLELSLIIICQNNRKECESCISSLLNNKFPRNKYEIIIIDDGSNNNDKAKLKDFSDKFSETKYIHQKTKGYGYSRNLGIEKAETEIILFVDSTTIASKYLIENHYKFHQKNQAENIICQGITRYRTESELGIWLKKKSYLFDEYLGPNPSFDQEKSNQPISPDKASLSNISFKAKLLSNQKLDPWMDLSNGENPDFFLNLQLKKKSQVLLNRECILNKKSLSSTAQLKNIYEIGKQYSLLNKKSPTHYPNIPQSHYLINKLNQNKIIQVLIKKISKILYPKTNSLYHSTNSLKEFFLGLNSKNLIK